MRKIKRPSTLTIRGFWEEETIPEEILIELAKEDPDNHLSESEFFESAFKIAIVIDGFHVRHHLAPKTATSGSDIVKWLDSLCVWAFENSSDDLTTIMSIVAWDGELAEGDETKSNFQNLKQDEQDRFLNNRRNATQVPNSDLAQASWHFLPLVVRKKHWDPRQSGVDARIATALLRAAHEGCDQLILITRDADYEDAVHLVNEHFPKIKVDVVTMGNKPPEQFERCDCQRWKGIYENDLLTMQKL